MTAAAHPLWRPRSGCGPDCLPVVEERPASAVRRAGRLVAVPLMLLAGLGLAVLLPLLPRRARQAAGRAWARGTVRASGVRLVVRGRLPRGPALLVANHVSWLDVPALLAVTPVRLVAKREVRDWPVVGVLARAAGTVFVDRSRPRDLPRAVAAVAAALRGGHRVAVFPEGTTRCGVAGRDACRPAGGFRPAMFQAAVDAGVPVVPVRIGYRCAATGLDTTAAAFLGEETLWRSVRRVLAAGDLVVTVHVAPALHPAAGADRRLLARTAESVVRLVPLRTPRPGGSARLAPIGPRVGSAGAVDAAAGEEAQLLRAA